MTDSQLTDKLREENEELQFKLQDLEYFIQIREEELEILKSKQSSLAELKSRINEQLYEMEQMQHFIGDLQQKAVGADNRQAEMEEEMLQSITGERKWYELQEQFQSMSAELEQTNEQLNEAVALYKTVKALKTKITELESSLEILQLDNGFLKEELEQLRNREEAYSSTQE